MWWLYGDLYNYYLSHALFYELYFPQLKFFKTARKSNNCNYKFLKKESEKCVWQTRLIIICVGCFSGMMGTETRFLKWIQVFHSFQTSWLYQGLTGISGQNLTLTANLRWNFFFILEPKLLKGFWGLSGDEIRPTHLD